MAYFNNCTKASATQCRSNIWPVNCFQILDKLTSKKHNLLLNVWEHNLQHMQFPVCFSYLMSACIWFRISGNRRNILLSCLLLPLSQTVIYILFHFPLPCSLSACVCVCLFYNHHITCVLYSFLEVQIILFKQGTQQHAKVGYGLVLFA